MTKTAREQMKAEIDEAGKRHNLSSGKMTDYLLQCGLATLRRGGIGAVMTARREALADCGNVIAVDFSAMPSERTG